MKALPLGVMPRIVSVNDALSALVPILEKNPWQRRQIETSSPHYQQIQYRALRQSGNDLTLHLMQLGSAMAPGLACTSVQVLSHVPVGNLAT